MSTSSFAPRASRPSRPGCRAITDPAQAPTMRHIAAPENQVTRARAMPKMPNWFWFLSTVLGIQTLAEMA